MSIPTNAYRAVDQLRADKVISDEVHAMLTRLLEQERAQGYAACADLMSGQLSARMVAASRESHSW